MSTKKLSPTEQNAINRKAILSLNVSPDTKSESTRRDLVKFSQEVQKKLLVWSHVKDLRVVLLEVEKEKQS